MLRPYLLKGCLTTTSFLFSFVEAANLHRNTQLHKDEVLACNVGECSYYSHEHPNLTMGLGRLAERVPSPSSICTAGVLSKLACCSPECGTCGGAFCDARPGGSAGCCATKIHALCQSAAGPPPCRYPDSLSEVCPKSIDGWFDIPEWGKPCFDSEHAADTLRINGFAQIHGALLAAEVDAMRKKLQAWRSENLDKFIIEGFSPQGHTYGALLPNAFDFPEIRGIFRALRENRALHALLHEFFQGRKYRELLHSDAAINRRLTWHKDVLFGIDSDKYADYQKTNVWTKSPDGSRYGVLKVMLYLQDHRYDLRGLSVVAGSHRHHLGSKHYSGKLESPHDASVTLNPGLGDIVIIDQRISHRGPNPPKVIGNVNNEIDRLLLSYTVSEDNIFGEEHERGAVARQKDQERMIEKRNLKNKDIINTGKAKWKSSKAGFDLPGVCNGDVFCCIGQRGQTESHPRRPSWHKLSRIGHKYRDTTDKVPSSMLRWKHSFTEFYGPLFGASRDHVRRVLEVGVRFGGSLLMWRDFFPKAEILGIDLNLEPAIRLLAGHDSSRISLLSGDVGNIGFVDSLGNVTFDLIINDALKHRWAQTSFLNSFFHLIRSGGWLILEDVESAADAQFIVQNFFGNLNRLSVIDRTHGWPATCNERLIVYSAP